MTDPSWLATDNQHIWHPYAAIPSTISPYPVASAEGVYLTLADGRRLIDGMSSWWAAIHGYNHPVINAAAHSQIDTLAHVMFGGLTHRPAVSLAERLLNLVPNELEKIFFCDSGSVSVEVALKMAVQYWHARGNKSKSRFLALQGGYHGDTFGAMSVCDPINGMHQLFNQVLPAHFFAPRPQCRFHDAWDPTDIAETEAILQQHHQQIAAVILEPVVQGAGGMWFYHPRYLQAMRELCDQYEILLIADEIATGFGRSGELFACHHADVVPDILCLGKALTGGYLSLAATLTSAEVADTISSSDVGLFMHGPTFMANPLACSIATASIDLLLQSDWRQHIKRIQKQLQTGLAPCRTAPGVKDVRILGAIGVVEMDKPIDVAKMQTTLVNQGVWLRPFGRLLYTMPPYIIDTEQLNTVTQAMVNALQTDE